MNIKEQIAKDLLSIGAVFLRPEEPFTWASGIKSPIYCDNRLTLTAPGVRNHVENALAAIAAAKLSGVTNDAIKKVKGEVVSEDIDVEIDLSVNAYIPDNYITDELIKIEMYKKIASIESKEDMYDVQEELEDRFSDIPKSVETLLKIAYIKTLCKTLKIEKVRQIKDEILLNPLTRYKTKEKIGYNIVNELEELLENMCNLKLN